MKNPTNPLAQTQQDRKKNRAAIIAAALGAALCLVLVPLLTAQADASLDNGGFCIASTYDSDPEIKGVAGGEHCVAPSATPTPEPTPTPTVPVWAPPAPRIISCDANAKRVAIGFRSYAMPGVHELTLEREVYVDGALVEKTVKEAYSSGDVGTTTSFLNEQSKATKGYYYAGKSISIAYRILNKRYGPTPWTVADATTNDGGATYQCTIR